MQIADQCDEIGTTLLLSDADLALRSIRIALSRPHPAGERQATAIRNAKTAYRRICELASRVQMDGNALQNLIANLEAIRVALAEAEENRTKA